MRYTRLVVAIAIALGVRPAHERYFGVLPIEPDPARAFANG